MKIVQINTTCGIGSTGKICVGISEVLTENNIENYILYSCQTNGYRLGKSCSNNMYVKWQAIKAKIKGNYGFNSKMATKKMIKYLDEIEPDIVHLHNIHGHDVNIEILFEYLKKKEIKILWTFHDCWALTAYCPYFTQIKCDKWKNTCSKCPQKRQYLWFVDRSFEMYNKKKKLLEGLDLTIVTPSKWLKKIVKESFLAGYPVKVINNGINFQVFRPTKKTLREKYNVAKDVKIVLGVAFEWDKRKGLDVFNELAVRLGKEYQIVLVGTNQQVDKQLAANIISIHRTQNQLELAEIYSSADVFVNPTKEENFPTVNIEALACGTPVLTFNTGGSPEILDTTCGKVVECEDIDELYRWIIEISQKNLFDEQKCVERALQFDYKEKFQEYIELYKKVMYE